MSIIIIAGAAAGFAVLALLFAKNLLRARQSGEIYNGAILIRRSESPINFWITVVDYVVATAVATVAPVFCAFILF